MLKKVFLPKCCTQAPAGIMVGTSNPDSTVFYVVAIIHFPVKPGNLNSYLDEYGKQYSDVNGRTPVALRPLGTWLPYSSDLTKDREQMVPKLFGQTTWITVRANKNESGDVEFLTENLKPAPGDTRNILSGNSYCKVLSDFIVVIYNQKEIWDGEFSDEAVFNKADPLSGELEGLFNIVWACKNYILTYESGIYAKTVGISVTHCCVEREVSIVQFLLTAFVTVILIFLNSLLHAVQNSFRKATMQSNLVSDVFSKFIELFTFMTHAKKRMLKFCESLSNLFQDTLGSDPFTDAGYGNHNTIASVAVDIILGIMFLWSLYYYKLLPSDKTTTEVFLPYVETIARQVEELIEWLMGIPAGLKLNHQLNQFLGHFFMYHVRLWLEYAKMMMSLLPHMITYCLMSSCCGLSFLLAIISDATSTLSFHVYCFYVYAGRLYGLQVAGLMSLWRLFRGKKWNPLRKRVDSLEESGQRADQLFVGTIFFTVLLFLLPTTALYYGIFMLLRVAVLAIQALLSGLRFLLTEFPWYSFVVRMFNPHKFIKSVQIIELNVPATHKAGQALAFQMSIQPKSIGGVINTELKKKRNISSEAAGFKTFFGKIVFGDLIRWA